MAISKLQGLYTSATDKTILKDILPSLGPPGWHSGQTVVIYLSSAGWFPVLLCSPWFPPGSSAQWQKVWLHSAHTPPGCGLVVWPPWGATWPPASALGSPDVYKEEVQLLKSFVRITAEITVSRLLFPRQLFDTNFSTVSMLCLFFKWVQFRKNKLPRLDNSS